MRNLTRHLHLKSMATGLLLAGFLMFPNIKGDDTRVSWLIISPTLIRLGLIAGLIYFAVRNAVVDGFDQRRNLLLVAFFFLLSAMCVPWADFDEYGTDKVFKLFTLTLLSAALPPLLIRDDRGLRRLFTGLAVVGMIYGLSALLTLFRGDNPAYRLTALNSNPITVGRAAGYAMVWIVLLLVGGQIKGTIAKLGTYGLLLISAFSLIGSGSRGPIISSVVSIAACVALFFRGSIRRKHVAAIATLVLVGVVLASTVQLNVPPVAFNRLASFAQGQFGNSELARAEAFDRSVDQIFQHPLGIGWGGFETQVNLWRNGDKLSYPHNLVLEVFLEAGWLTGAYFLMLMGLGFWRGLRNGATFERAALFTFFIYSTINAMVSGDINSNRLVLALLSIALCLNGLQEAASAAPQARASDPEPHRSHRLHTP